MSHYYADIESGTVGVIERSADSEEVVATFPEDALGDIIPTLVSGQQIGTMTFSVLGKEVSQPLIVEDGKIGFKMMIPPGIPVDVYVETIGEPEP